MEGLSKQYLYHKVPENMTPNEEGKNILYPLNVLKEKFPGLYEVHIQKYLDSEYRKNIPDQIIPNMDATWGDVIQMTAVHPEDLKKELTNAGFNIKELKFYQIDPDLLKSENTKVFLYKDDLEEEDIKNYITYDPKNLHEHSVIPESSKKYLKEKAGKKEKPLLFVNIPHVLHKGEIDVSNLPVIIINSDESGK